MTSPGTPANAGLTAVVGALQTVLAAHHAAIFGFPVIGVQLSVAAQVERARQAESAHRAARDGLLIQLAVLGTPGTAAAVQYQPSTPVTDASSAQQWGLALEQGCASGYRNLLTATGATGVVGLSTASLTAYRNQGLAGLITAAADARYWRALLTPNAPTVPLPGV